MLRRLWWLTRLFTWCMEQYFAREEDHGAPIDCSADPHSQVKLLTAPDPLQSSDLLTGDHIAIARFASTAPKRPRGCRGTIAFVYEPYDSLMDGDESLVAVGCSVVSAVGSLSLIFMSPIIGRASDVYGRKVAPFHISMILMMVYPADLLSLLDVPRDESSFGHGHSVLHNLLHAAWRLDRTILRAETGYVCVRVRVQPSEGFGCHEY